MVSYSYQHLQRSDRKFKFGCVLPASRLESHPLSKAGYEVLWSFLGSPTTTALPKGAFKVNRLQVKTASSPPKSILMESIISYDDRLEVESRDVISLSPGDIVLCDFTVLQYDDFRFVADRIDECVWGYTVDCRRGDAGDIGAIFPLALFSASEEPAIRVDQDDLVTASVSSEGWVIPSGAAIFSWSPKVRTVVNSDLPSVDAAALALMKELGARSQGTFFDLGPATEALKAVGMRMAEAAKVQNTFIGQNVPYSPESRDLVEGVLAQLLKRNIYYEETCSFSRRDRVDRLWNKLQGIIPATYKARILREELSGMPACNFTIVTHDASRSFQEEVFFGWGFFEHSANDHVFWSNDVRLISFFRDYHQALRHPSVSDEYAPGATGPIPQQ